MKRRARASLRVSVTDGRGRAVAGGLARWLSALGSPTAPGTVAVAVVSDARMRVLNRRYRGIDAVTDVLSFPVGPSLAEDASPPLLGDIVIATGRASRQARAAGHSLTTELRVLALHGLLHLLGYDHARDDGRMARAERRLRRAGGLRESLVERAQAASRCPAPGRRTSL